MAQWTVTHTSCHEGNISLETVEYYCTHTKIDELSDIDDPQ